MTPNPAGEFSGTTYTSNVPASEASSVLADVEGAYTALGAMTGASDLNAAIAANTGDTLPPGLYAHSGAWSLAAGTSLAFQGASTDVWVIQITGAVAINGNTVLSGARQANIQWYVTGGFSLAIGCTCHGTKYKRNMQSLIYPPHIDTAPAEQ
jgi:hypothetical protein